MSTLRLADASLHYTLEGDSGPLVVQLHGLMSSCIRDALLGLDLGRALPGHRVLRYDARAHGGSTGSWDSADYVWDSLAEDLLALLDHVAPGEPVHGVGSSMGAGTLLHAATRHPQRFQSLALITPPTAWESRRRQSSAYLVGADFVEREGLAAFVELGSAMPRPPALANAPETEPAVLEQLLPTILRGAARSDLPAVDVVAAVDVPVLVLAWVDDATHPLRTAEILADVMPQGRLVVANTPLGIMAWPMLLADHVTASAELQPGSPSTTDHLSPVASDPATEHKMTSVNTS